MLSLSSVVVTLLAAELSLRLYHAFWYHAFSSDRKEEIAYFSPITLDEQLGWRATENYRFTGTKMSLDRTEYKVQMSQNAEGFRMFGDLNSAKPRILVIGDSFTQAVQVSDDKTYYAVVKKALGAELFAYGVGGYGTLQEYMVFNKYIDVIKPQLVIWQYAVNDIINNSPYLEAKSLINNNNMVRPYWVNGHVERMLPRRFAKVQAVALRYCRICYFVMTRVDMIAAAHAKETVENQTQEGGPAYGDFMDAVKVTNELMGMVRRRASHIPIVAFVVGTANRYGRQYENAFKQISARNDINILNVEPAVVAAEKRGVTVKAEDGAHWNEAGHRIAGESIAQALTEMCLLHLCERPQ